MKKPGPLSTLSFVLGFAIAIALFAVSWPIQAGNDYMVLTTTDYESGISYRDVQWHHPIGTITNPCSYADKLVPSIDWNDGGNEHKPDTNIVTTLFDKRIPVVQSGIYLFWDDSHTVSAAGASSVTTKLTFHCLGDPPGDRVAVTRNTVHSYARVPVNDVEFSKNGKPIDSVKGHDTVDVTITLDSPAPPSGTWVKLTTVPDGVLSALPSYFAVSAGETQARITDLEVRKPASEATLNVVASTVGRAQQTQALSILP